MPASWAPPTLAGAPRIVIVDNYDSYAYNLYQRIGELTGVESVMIRNDKTSVEFVELQAPTHIIISPGPGNTGNHAYFGICGDVIRRLGKRTPILGVCLGHQGIGHVFGGRIVRAPAPMHGKTSVVLHDGTGVFRDIESPLTVMRYHSLIIDPETVPDDLSVSARTADGIIMGVAHKKYPIHGVQFHPESIGTPLGIRILRNFLELRPSK